MTMVSMRVVNGLICCEIKNGTLAVKGEAKTFLGVLAKTYFKLIIKRFRIFNWRETWTEH